MTIESIISESLAPVGLKIGRYVVGNGASVRLMASKRTVLVGEDDSTEVDQNGVLATVYRQARRGKSGNSVFVATLNKIYPLVLLVIVEERRVVMLQDTELNHAFDRALRGEKVLRISRATNQDRAVRISVPKQRTAWEIEHPYVRYK